MLQRCATERRFREVLQNAMQRIIVEDRCRVKCYKEEPEGVAAEVRCRERCRGTLQLGSSEEQCRGALQRDTAEEC